MTLSLTAIQTKMNKRDYYFSKPFNQLVLKNKYTSIRQIPYEDLLNTREWFVKRIKILDRDNFFCKSCGGGESELEVKGLHLIPYNQHRFLALTLQEGYEILHDVIDGNSQYPIYLHVHHKYYYENKLPWDYPDDALVSMCSKCHYEFHQHNTVPYYDNNGTRISRTPCYRCKGAGIFPEFNHVIGGLCFRCKGEKFEELIRTDEDT